MGKYNLRKSSIIMTIMVFIIIASLVLLRISRGSDPLEPVKEMRNMVEKYELISTKQTDDGILLYSAGIVNKERDNFYFVDMVKKTLTGYKWTGGGGHINRNIGYEGDYIISMQLLNEKQNIIPTILGIIPDENVSSIRVSTLDELSDATFYNGRDEYERFYVLNFEKDVADVHLLIISMTYVDGSRVEFITKGEDMENLQKGRVLYFYKEDIEKLKAK